MGKLSLGSAWRFMSFHKELHSRCPAGWQVWEKVPCPLLLPTGLLGSREGHWRGMALDSIVERKASSLDTG